MPSDSSDLQRLSQNWIPVTWQLGDRERQRRRSLIALQETLGEVLQRALMEACSMGYLNKKIAFTEPAEFARQWQVFVVREGEEVRLPLDQRVEALALQAEERLIFRPLSITPDNGVGSMSALPSSTGLPQSFIQSPPSNSVWMTYLLLGVVLALAGVVAFLLLR